MCLLWWSSSVSSFFWSENVHNYLCPLLWSSYCKLLSFFIYVHQNAPISQNIEFFIKQIWNIAPKQFFKGVPHQQDWSSIVCLLWWSSIVSSFFEVNIFQSPFLLSFSYMFICLLSLFHSFGFLKMSNFQNIGCLIKTH